MCIHVQAWRVAVYLEFAFGRLGVTVVLIGADEIMGVLIGQVTRSLLALTRGTIDSTRAADFGSLHSASTKALLTFQKTLPNLGLTRGLCRSGY